MNGTRLKGAAVVVSVAVAFLAGTLVDAEAPPATSTLGFTSTTSAEVVPPPTQAGTTTTAAPPQTSSSTASPPAIVRIEVGATPPTEDEALQIARTLAPHFGLPSDCPLPLSDPASLPNSPREYRAGVHQGIDFICEETGRSAVAAADGRVVMAVGDYTDPSPEDRAAVLGIAAERGSTPPFTLAMLFGNFVVIDHGVIDDAGHVITVYAHLDNVEPGIAPGVAVAAGQLLGEIGNRGTDTAATGGTRPRSIHLHWEIIVDDTYLATGLDASSTAGIYDQLFS